LSALTDLRAIHVFGVKNLRQVNLTIYISSASKSISLITTI
jgi:hypothetical protein